MASDTEKKAIKPADNEAREAAARAYASEHPAEPEPVEAGEPEVCEAPLDLEGARRDASALVRVALLAVATVRARQSPGSAVAMARGAEARAASVGARLAPRWAGRAWLSWAGLAAEIVEPFLQERIDAAEQGGEAHG